MIGDSMKYIKKLIILIILFLPILVNAKLNEIELENQFNTYHQEIQYFDDYFLTDGYDLKNKELVYKTYDLEGNEIASLKLNNYSEMESIGNHLYYNEEDTNKIIKLKGKTLEKVKEITTDEIIGYIYTTNNNQVVAEYYNDNLYKYEIYDEDLNMLTSFTTDDYSPIIGEDYYITEEYEYSTRQYTYNTYDYSNKNNGTYITDTSYYFRSTEDNKDTYLYDYNSSTLIKINPRTLEVEKEITAIIPIKDMVLHEDKVYINNSNKYYVYNKDLSDYKEITKEEYYSIEDEYYNIKPKNVISDKEYEKFINYLESELGNLNKRLFINYAIEYNNQYYTVIINEGNIVSLVYADKDLTDFGLVSLKNDDFLTDELISRTFLLSNSNGITLLSTIGDYCAEANTIDYYPLYQNSYESCGANIIFQTYTPIYNIETKTDGNGTIKVLSTAKSGEGVTFEITPKEGYVLGVVKVTDKDGNVLTFTDYKFTMPSSDVTIEATFLPENPETSDLITYIILLFGLTTLFIIYIKNEQKRKYYKNIK